MTYLYYGARPATVYDPAVDQIAPNDAAFSVTDLAGTFVQDSGKIRMTRSTSDGQGLEHTAPGARVRFAVTLLSPGLVNVAFQWTGLITRDDIYNAHGEIWVNGSLATAFVGPTKGPSDPHPTGTSTIPLALSAGVKIIDLIFPYCASVDFKGVEIPATASIQAASPRPTKRGVFIGDSITQGFSTTKATAAWAFLTALETSSQILNHGYGGRVLTPGDTTVCGAYGCDFGVLMMGVNNFLNNGESTATFKTNYKTSITNWRAATTSAGKPNAPLYVITPIWCGPDDGLGPFVANSPTLEAFRQAIRDAVSEVADPYVVLIEGNDGAMPVGPDGFDGPLVHPFNGPSVDIASVVAGEIA